MAKRSATPRFSTQLPYTQRNQASPNVVAPPIVVELHTPKMLLDCGRHLNCIAANAAIAGSPFLLKCSKLLLAAVARKAYGPELLSHQNFSWLEVRSLAPAGSLILTDDAAKSNQREAIEMKIGRDWDPRSPVMPYPMHHRTLGSLANINLQGLRHAERRKSVFFAGKLKKSYRVSEIENQFGVVNRGSLIDAIKQQLSEHIQPVDSTNVAKQRSTSRISIELFDSTQDSITPNDWLPTLARYSFFLCCPGVCQPMCHNVIEAMSVGTIPLLEYADRFSPILVDGVNAICFRGTSGLVDAIDRIDSLSYNEIATMRQHVIAHYETHLRGDRFLASLRDQSFAEPNRIISLPFHNENYFVAEPSFSARAA